MKKIKYFFFGLLIVLIIFCGLSMMYYSQTIVENYINFDYSKTVDLPLTFPFSCKNFCGPNNTCAITGEQCSDDYDCTGCENMDKLKPQNVEPYYRELSKNNDQMDSVYVGSKNNLVPSNYLGKNSWINTFNEGIKMYNEKEMYNNKLTDYENKILPSYPKNISMTGEYYETTPPAFNA
jgi:hypothetical protein